MKKSKVISVLILLLTIILGSFVFLKSCDSKNVDKSVFYQKETKTTKPSTKDKKDAINPSKTSDREKSTTSTTTMAEDSASVSTESGSQVEVPASQTDNSSSQQGSENITLPEGGTGGWEATSGVLELDKEVPVYTNPNKGSGVAYVQSAGEIEWNGYFYENGEWWYSFQGDGGNGATKFYIAYSDVGH